jgi:hypothetical protein
MVRHRALIVMSLLLLLAAVGCNRGNTMPEPTVTPAAPRIGAGATDTPVPPAADTPAALTPTAEPETLVPEARENASPAPESTPTASPVPANQAEWTVMVYMAADNDLERQALLDMAEMEAAGSAKPVNVLVQLDRIPGEADGSGDWTGTRRFRLGPRDADPAAIDAELLVDLGETNMGDPEVLADFVVWSVTNFPAKRYALILWNHGAGWLGVAFDDTTPGYDELSMKELNAGLDRALAKTGVSKLDIVGFDACLMGQLDVYESIQPYARYAVGSEELVPGLGWDYQALLANLYETPDMSAVRLARHMVFDYIDYYSLVQPDDYVTMSAVDLAAWPVLKTATESLAQALLEDPVLLASAVGDARAGAEAYAAYYPEDMELYAAVDLWHFASILRERSPAETVAEAAAAVMRAVESAVVAESHGAGLTYSRGISIYFPRIAEYLAPEYGTETPLLRWNEFLAAYHGAGLADIPSPGFSIVSTLDESASYQAPGYMEVEITGRDIESVYLMVGRVQADGRMRLLEYDYLIPEPTILEDGSALYEWQDGLHEDFFVWTTELPYLTDGATGDFAVMWPTDYEGDLYVIEGSYLPAGAGKSLEANLVLDTATGEMDSLWGLQAGPGGAPYEILPQPGDGFQIFDIFMDETAGLVRQPGALLTFGGAGSLSYTFRPAPSGEYYVGFSAETIAGSSAEAFQRFDVDNDTLEPGRAAYLDPYFGFQFLYPDSWYLPTYEGAQLYSSDAAAETWLTVSPYAPGSGPTTPEALAEKTLAEFGPVSVLYEQEILVAGEPGRLTAYGYLDEAGISRTGLFFTTLRNGVGIVVDLDGLESAEAKTLAVMEALVTSWTWQPVAFGVQSGGWTELVTDGFTAAQPEGFTVQELDGGWVRFSAPDGSSFAAFRTDVDSGAGRLAVVDRWLAVAAEGVASFRAAEPYRFALGGHLWMRADFVYLAEDGADIWGYVMVTLVGDQEVVAWTEAPAEIF